ncbi:NAD(P)H-dependent flavin oxidoreductase [Brevibacterium luteolum]|uniref:NAD(P)H-dependent flavin oxidoreductase n=1 Tax=Brevibacterium luteolum TaxID=199591 RepID=UPI00223ADE26|nr:nitronate monooxygenase family protein [Brevibacterium luteolum]MCT1872552.1 nitronate monooxygenase family protein [Brevibacterium luteolum]MCT1890391.1 nitronate monooxygenase family protein [Brevibacterium luteolum]MCT1892881.1 nitronate monooxygenase family protein [Brevibacterium luteolum]MCT1923921.1 nitronate monooxygenase family protein [Brevibacterium luteolum]
MALPEVLTRPLRLPVIASPMFIASGPQLVTAQCQAGVIGAFPTLNARPAELLDEWLHEIEESNAAFAKANPDKPVGAVAANLIVHRSNNRIEADLETIVKHQVPIVITSLGARTEVNDAVHSYGGIVLHDVIHNGFAHKAIDKGADGLILVAAGAGGHAGMLSPFAFLNEVRAWFDGPIALSGALAHGRSVLAAQAAGADFAYVGSAFLSTPEAQVTDGYRQMIVDSTASDIVYTNLFTGVHGNYLRGSIEAAGLDPDNLPESDPSKMNFGSGGSEKSKAWRDIWGSGQGIGTIDESLPAGELVARLADEYEAAKADMLATLGAGS